MVFSFSSVRLLWTTHLRTLGRAHGTVQLKHWVLFTCYETAGCFDGNEEDKDEDVENEDEENYDEDEV